MDNRPMPEPLDFDPCKIRYDPMDTCAEFVKQLILLKGAQPIPEYSRDSAIHITAEKLPICGIHLIIEYLDTRFAQHRVLPLNPCERAAMQMLTFNILKSPHEYTPEPFILGNKCSLADLAFATATHNVDYLKTVICNLSSNSNQ